MLSTHAQCTIWPGLLSTVLTVASLFKLTGKDLLTQPLECLSAALPLIVVGNLAIVLLSNRIASNTLTAIVRLLGSIMALSAVIHIVAVLLGAPFLDKLWSTACFSVLVATVVCLSVTNQLGIAETEIYTRVFMKHRPITNSEMAAYIQAVSVLVGAWLGAVVIPLDWERPWQQWPISCVLGAIVGQAIGSVGTTVLYFMPTTVENDDRKNQ